MTTHPRGSGTHPTIGTQAQELDLVYDHDRDSVAYVKDVASTRKGHPNNSRNVTVLTLTNGDDTWQIQYTGIPWNLEPAHSGRDKYDALGLHDEPGTFDTATPRRMWDLTNEGHPFVMDYDEDGVARPRPLTVAGRDHMIEYNDREGTEYSTDWVVLKKVDEINDVPYYVVRDLS
jgi:hypothetical protein